MKRGVYFLANDKVLELSIAFLNSFRKHNPTIPLCLIPYDSNFKKIASLSDKYDFYILVDKEVLQSCDEISKDICDCVSGNFRKLAMWKGIFDEFIYIDVDTVVLKNVEFSFAFLSEYDFINSHSNIPSIRKWVWKDSIYNANVLSRDQIDFAANMGYFVSHKKALPLAFVQKKLASVIEIKEHMELWCVEQAFLNYLFVTSGRYTSLLTLFMKNPYQKIPLEQWGGRKYGIVIKGNIYFPDERIPVLLIHWAGIYRLKDYEKWVYTKISKLGIKKEMPDVSLFMPYRRLWKYYRYMKA